MGYVPWAGGNPTGILTGWRVCQPLIDLRQAQVESPLDLIDLIGLKANSNIVDRGVRESWCRGTIDVC